MSVPPVKSRAVDKRDSLVTPDWQAHAAPILIVLGVWIAYANSFSAPFVFDDNAGILKNDSIRQLWPIWDALWASALATGATGRPVVNLSLAINHALGGLDVQGYHLFNTLLHSLAALTLFGLVRRTLLRPTMPERFRRPALPLSFTVALLWGLHPLLTESVTCVIQRTELLGSLFYLLTLYAFVRSLEGNVVRWRSLSVLACLAGMASKEIMVTAPVIVLLYDRTFAAGTFKEAWRQRRRFYLALASTWLLLGFLVVANDNRGGVVGFGLGMSPWNYALTQCRAIILYLRLSFWPHPLILDYGAETAQSLAEVWWQGMLLLALVAGTFVALVKKPVVGFVAFTFFSILAPSSSFVPLTTQTIAEHRMYLPLACVVLLVVLAAYRRWGRWVVPAALLVAVLAGGMTVRRNRDYLTTTGIWADTVAKWPDNARARLNLGKCYAEDGDLDAAQSEFQSALRLKPRYADAAFNLGNLLMHRGLFPQAAERYQQALGDNPDLAAAHYALGYCLVRTGRIDEGLAHYQRANQLQPGDVTTVHSYASALGYAGRRQEALDQYAEALRLSPDDPELLVELARLLIQWNRPAQALPHLERAVRLAPAQTGPQYALAMVLWQLGRFAAAADQLGLVIKAQPGFAEAYNSLGMVLLAQERWREAVENFTMALRLKPDFTEARANLERAELLRDLRG